MDDEGIDGQNGREIRDPWGEGYRTCSVCGGDCEPEPSAVDGLGVRIMFACSVHGVHSIVDPLSDLR